MGKKKAKKSALLAAARTGNAEMVRHTVKSGADKNRQFDGGRTALHNAAELGHLPVVETLLDVGASVDLAASNGETPLYVAAARGRAGVVVALLKAGANPNKMCHGQSPASVARDKDIKAMFTHVNKGGVAGELPSTDRSAQLRDAAQGGEVEAVLRVLEGGVDVNAADEDGWTALHFAAEHGGGDMVQELLDRGAQADAVERRYGRTPLHVAALANKDDVLALLKGAGGDAKVRDSEGKTADEYLPAVEVEDGRCSNCGEYHVYDESSYSDDMYGAYDGDMYGGYGYGGLPMLMPGERYCIECGDIHNDFNHYGFDSCFSDVQEELIEAARSGDMGEVTTLLDDDGADIDYQDEDGIFALFAAAEYGHEDIVSYLIERGADTSLEVTFADSGATTALQVAACEGHLEVARALLDGGVDVNEIDSYGNTALHAALDVDNVVAALWLLEKGAKAHLKNDDGQLPIDRYRFMLADMGEEAEEDAELIAELERRQNDVGRSVKAARPKKKK